MTRPKRRLSANRGEIKRDGLRVTPFYDPLLAKIMVHGGDRQEAIRRLADLLARVRSWALRPTCRCYSGSSPTPHFARATFPPPFSPNG